VAFEVRDPEVDGPRPGDGVCGRALETGETGSSRSEGVGYAQQRRGALLLNGKPARTSEIRRLSCYIPQVCSILRLM